MCSPYDQLGRWRALAGGDIGRKEYHYDRYGNMDWESDSVLRGKGQRIQYIYDEFNRLMKIDYPESGDTVYEYGKPGAGAGQANRLSRVEDESGTIRYEYGLLGEIVKETRTIGDPNPLRAGREARSVNLFMMQGKTPFLSTKPV